MSVEIPGAASGARRHHKIGRHWKVQPAAPHPDGLSYQDLREQIRTGDLLLFRGNRIFSDAIERLSDSPYSHVAILARWNDRVIAFQADTQGVQLLPASKMVCKYQGKVDWWSLKQTVRDQGVFDPKALLDASLTLLGIKYGYWELIKLAFRIMLGRALPRKDAHATPDSLFCSQFVSRCFRAASHDVLDVNPSANDACTSPANFVTSGFFEQRCALFDGSNGQACQEMLEIPPGTNRPDVVPWNGQARAPAVPGSPAAPAGQAIRPT